MSKTLAGKRAASNKRPTIAGDQLPPKKSKGFTTKKKSERSSIHKETPVSQRIEDKSHPLTVGKPLKVEDSPTIAPPLGEEGLVSTLRMLIS